MSADERLYVRARLILNAAVIAWWFVAVQYDQRFWTTGLLLAVMMTLGTGLIVFSARRGNVAWAMLRVLASDLVVLAGFTYLYTGFEDIFFVVTVFFTIAYALVVSRRQAWSIGLMAAFAYLVGRLVGEDLDLMHLMFVISKVVAIPLFAVMVAASVEKSRQREAMERKAVAEKEQLNEVMQRQLSELRAVAEITEVVHSSLDFERIGPVVLEILARVLGLESCCLFVIDKDRSETLFSASYGMTAAAPPSFDERGLELTQLEEHFACMAVFDHGDTMVLFCTASDSIQALTDEDRLVLTAVASELVVAVENSRLYRLTKKLSVTDELTGLANYRALQQKLDEEIERARRYGKRLSLLMIDADDFKRFNDTHGHLAGDAALNDMGNVMRLVTREVDLVARYGGEEFSVVLPETDAAGAFVVAEKLREAVATHAFVDGEGAHSAALTVSIGLATFPTHAWDKESLLREADDALYNAKNSGRNRVRTPFRPVAAAVDGGNAAENENVAHENLREGEASSQPDAAHSRAEDEWTDA